MNNTGLVKLKRSFDEYSYHNEEVKKFQTSKILSTEQKEAIEKARSCVDDASRKELQEKLDISTSLTKTAIQSMRRDLGGKAQKKIEGTPVEIAKLFDKLIARSQEKNAPRLGPATKEDIQNVEKVRDSGVQFMEQEAKRMKVFHEKLDELVAKQQARR